MPSLRLWSLALLSAVSIASNNTTGSQIAAHFRKVLSPSTGVFLPSDSNYTTETIQRWDTFSEPTYVVSVKPALDTDVQKIIRYAYENDISFLGTGGGHGYTTTVGSVQNGIQIDLGAFNFVSIDEKVNTMTVGGSVRFGDISGRLYDAGKEFQVGSDSCVGLLGASIGGGIGPYGGLHGLQLDALLSVRIVTGTGAILDVSATSYPDLFWGIRGAGHNFGIITSAVYQVYNFSNNGQAMNADFRIAASQNASVWEYIKSYELNQPDELGFELGLAYDETYGGTYLLVNVIYVGPLDEGTKLVEPLINLNPISQNITEIPWKDIEPQSKFGVDGVSCIKGRMHSVYSVNVYQIDVPTLINFTNYLSDVFIEYPALRFGVWVIVQYANRVIKSVPDDATAYPWRDTTGYVHFDIGFADNSVLPIVTEVGEASRSMLLKTSGAQDLEVYVNLAHGDEGEVSWYSARKLPRLHALKKTYDPNQLFSHYNGLSI